MPLFVMADLHLSTATKTNKSMEVFGHMWKDYTTKIQKNWNNIVSDNDTVIVPGDISWAMSLKEATSDLSFINSLNGKKLIGKGNHDFWWATNTKMTSFFKEKGFDTLSVLYNNAYIVEDKIICGTRGWFPDQSQQNVSNPTDYAKLIRREAIRFELSLIEAKKLQDEYENENNVKLPILVFLHFPPVWKGFVLDEFIELLLKYEIKDCFYGHIHNLYTIPRSFEYENIKFTLTSSDFLRFIPLKI